MLPAMDTQEELVFRMLVSKDRLVLKVCSGFESKWQGIKGLFRVNHDLVECKNGLKTQ